MTRTVKSDADDPLDRVATATGLREGREGVVGLLRAVHRLGPGPLNRVAREARLPVPIAAAVRRELEREGLLGRTGGVSLTRAGERFVAGSLGLGEPVSVRCAPCGGTGLAVPDAEFVNELKRFMGEAPPVDVTLDQAPCTAETAIRRALLMVEAGAVEGRRIVLLGDDDSLSLALGLVHRALGMSPLPAPITVLEIDPNWTAYLEAAATRADLPVAIVRHDLRTPLTDAVAGRFDVMATDPPYTLAGASLFLARARQALATEPGSLGFLSFAHLDPVRQRALMAAIGETGFAVTAMMPGFNHYQGAGILGSVGQMMRLVAAAEAPEAVAHDGDLYTADVSPRERRYRCAGCGIVLSLGQGGVPATIEALKAAGCPQCGAGTFRRVSGGRG